VGFVEMNFARRPPTGPPVRNPIDTAIPDDVGPHRHRFVGEIFLATRALRDLPTPRGRRSPVPVRRDKGL
jgi:hypothetical protein